MSPCVVIPYEKKELGDKPTVCTLPYSTVHVRTTVPQYVQCTRPVYGTVLVRYGTAFRLTVCVQ